MKTRGALSGLAALSLVTTVAACGGSDAASDSDTLTLYTCVSDTTIQPVIEAFEKANPDAEVELYRAPTGDLNARVAGDVRSGGLKADVVWTCDPLTMQDYVDQDLVGGWTPETDIPADVQTDDYVGVAMLYMVAAHGKDVPGPQSWSDLTGDAYEGSVAVPDPEFAASALGTLGYFADNPSYGIDFYGELKANGTEQVSTPDDVTLGVADGVYDAGITIANSAYAAQADGSPIEVVWPEPGAVAIYGPIALAAGAQDSAVAQDFISYVASAEGQRLIADSGSYPTLEGVEGPTIPPGAKTVSPDWAKVGAEKDTLLDSYRQIFGG